MDLYQIISRWESVLRLKAAEYEHEARKQGKEVTSPSLDSICNEMTAFVAGVRTTATDQL